MDADILCSKTLRDWLFLLRAATQGGLFTVARSNDVIAETLYSIHRKNPDGPGHVTGNVKEGALDEIVRDFPAQVSFPGEDGDDVHVHASATACRAVYVLTNDKGFSEVSLGFVSWKSTACIS